MHLGLGTHARLAVVAEAEPRQRLCENLGRERRHLIKVWVSQDPLKLAGPSATLLFEAGRLFVSAQTDDTCERAVRVTGDEARGQALKLWLPG